MSAREHSAAGGATWLTGHGAGISCLSKHWPSTRAACSALFDWTDGAGPLVKLLGQWLGE